MWAQPLIIYPLNPVFVLLKNRSYLNSQITHSE